MLILVASSRPEYDPALQTLAVSIPSSAARGDVLLLFVVHADASSIDVPDGWTDLGSNNASGITVRRIVRMLDGTEDASFVVDLNAAGDEVQGALVALRHAGTMPLLVEASGALAFAATLAPALPAVSCLQAINLTLEIWSSSGSLALAPPVAATAIDTYSTALLAARTLLIATRRANATGALALGVASSNANATGASFAFVLRSGLPIQPLDLFDPVPGNIGLLGRDSRPPREVS